MKWGDYLYMVGVLALTLIMLGLVVAIARENGNDENNP